MENNVQMANTKMAYIPRMATVIDLMEASNKVGDLLFFLSLFLGSPPRAAATEIEANGVIQGWIAEVKKIANIPVLLPVKKAGSFITEWVDKSGKTFAWSSVNTIELWEPVAPGPTDTVN